MAGYQPGNLSELAAASGLAKSTTYRLLATLSHHGLAQEQAKGGYRLAESWPWLIGGIPAVQMERDWVRAKTGETVNFGVLVGTEIQYVARSLSDHALRWGVEVGSCVPSRCSGRGKAVLAFRPEVMRVPDGPAHRIHGDHVGGPRGPGRRGALVAVRPRARGIPAVRVQLVVPVLGSEGVAVWAISVSGPAVRFGVEDAKRHVQLLQ